MSDEHFSLQWDNFHKNMSAGIQSLLESEDLVDVTLAVEGRQLKAHKMVLSLCSPYFRQLFQSSPCKHPIVFMRDVTYTALIDLLQFMYHGEVQVAEENLSIFIKTAEALQIKGLAEDSRNHFEDLIGTTKSTNEATKRSTAEVSPPFLALGKRLRSKRVRVSSPSPSSSAAPAVVPAENLIFLKTEPSDNTETSTDKEVADETQDSYVDETSFEKDNISMETNEDEPKHGTSSDGTGESQLPTAKEEFEVRWCSVDDAVADRIPRNPVIGRLCRRRAFELFCTARSYEISPATTIPELASILKDYAFNIRRQDGTDYRETTLKVLWSSTARDLQHRFFEEFKIKFNPFKDKEFAAARKARDAKCKVLRKNPDFRSVSTDELTREEIDRMALFYDESTPSGLAKKFYVVSLTELAFRGNEVVSALVEHFTDEVLHDGTPTGRIRYNPIFSKTRLGGDKSLAGDKWLTPRISNVDLCPVRLFKKFISLRPPNASKRLFLGFNPHWNKPNCHWYLHTPIGKSTLITWTKEAARNIGLQGTFINHSTRPTLGISLTNANVPAQQLLLLTGQQFKIFKGVKTLC